MEAALWIASGRIERVNWPKMKAAHLEHPWWVGKVNELETEKYLRVALAAGAIFFVLLGAPVGVLFAKRDYLSAFITCFIPIIVLYYPLVLAGINLSKEGLAPHFMVCSGDLLLGVLSGFVLWPVWKH
jgi:lipopolysaccharide export system permease protein